MSRIIVLFMFVFVFVLVLVLGFHEYVVGWWYVMYLVVGNG